MGDMKKVAVLFPGQGSQFLGMGREFLEADPDAQALMDIAEKNSGFPLRKLCLDGPMEDLTRTVHLQPALTVINLICWQAVADAGIKPSFVAGHSLGEYGALCAAGVLSAEDALTLVTERGRLMEREAAKHPGSMRAVLGLTIDTVQDILEGLSGNGVVTAANHNSEKQVVISGEVEALDAAAAAVAEQGGKVIPLKVSGAWHSDLVKDAVPDFEKVMAKATFNSPKIPLLFNVTAKEENDPAVIRDIMARQIASTVRWFDIINTLMSNDVRVFIEVGPKTVLSGLLKKIVPQDYEYSSFQIDKPDSLAACLEKIGN